MAGLAARRDDEHEVGGGMFDPPALSDREPSAIIDLVYKKRASRPRRQACSSRRAAQAAEGRRGGSFGAYLHLERDTSVASW
jgi:hypothetical protein